MKPFRYGRDPLCLAALACYAVNRWVVLRFVGTGFFRNHFNDLLLIPAALPLVLGLHRWLGWRRHDHPPTMAEILGHLAVWTLIAEVLGPWLLHTGVADWRDAVAYAVGAGLAGVWWRWVRG